VYTGNPECKILGPNASSTLGATSPVRLTLSGGTTESGTLVTATEKPDVYVGFINFRNAFGRSDIQLVNAPAPTLKGKLGATSFSSSGTYVSLFGENALAGASDGSYVLQVTARLGSNPFIVAGTGLLQLIRKIGGPGGEVELGSIAYMGAVRVIKARAKATLLADSFPGVELSIDGPFDADSVEWSITRM
jgi:hypothetical protein